MGTIPVNTVVTVNISVSPTYPSRAGFGTLLCVTKETGVLTTINRTASYASIDEVSEAWSTSSEVYKFAEAYFSQSPSPTSFMVGIRYEENQAAVIKSGTLDDDSLTDLQVITDGCFKISIDGQVEELIDLDFSSATDFDDIATVVASGLATIGTGGFSGATCEYVDGKLVIVSGTDGATSLISYATAGVTGTDVSELLNLTQDEALKANGVDGETVAESLSALEESDSSWYGFGFTREVRDHVVINGEDAIDSAASWAEARVKVFSTATNDENTYNSASTSDIAYELSQRDLSRTIVVYSSYPKEYPEASVLGRAFSVDFTSGNPSITLKFKKLPGITVEGLSSNQKSVLDSKNCNALISIAGNTMFAEGKMSGGRFFDEVHGLDWLQNAIQTNVFGLLYSSPTKITYTDLGTAKVAQKVRDALEEAVTAGLGAPGYDSDDNYLSEGYEVTTTPVSEVSDSDSESRLYNGTSFTLLGAGAIHGVTVNGVFER